MLLLMQTGCFLLTLDHFKKVQLGIPFIVKEFQVYCSAFAAAGHSLKTCLSGKPSLIVGRSFLNVLRRTRQKSRSDDGVRWRVGRWRAAQLHLLSEVTNSITVPPVLSPSKLFIPCTAGTKFAAGLSGCTVNNNSVCSSVVSAKPSIC